MYNELKEGSAKKMSLLKTSAMLLTPFLLFGCADLLRSNSASNSGSNGSFQPVMSMGVLADIQGGLATSERLAAKGDANAQARLGSLYWDAQYYSDSFNWYEKAAMQGNAFAQYRVGYAYVTGKGVGKNLDAAREWYQKAAAQGHSQALKELVILGPLPETYVSIEDNEPVYSTTALPQPEIISANTATSGPLITPTPMPVNTAPVSVKPVFTSTPTVSAPIVSTPVSAEPVVISTPTVTTQAINTGTKAIFTSEPIARPVETASTSGITQPGPIIDQNASETIVAPSEPVVIEKPSRAEPTPVLVATPIVTSSEAKPSTVPEAPVEKPSTVQNTANTSVNKGNLELSALQSAAEEGDVDAQQELSVLYLEGKKVPKNLELSVKWGEKAANQGNMIAQNNLGAAYTHGNGVAKDVSKAFSWYEKSSKQGYSLAQYNLAAAYAMGVGVDKDYVKSYAWFKVVSQSKEANTLLDERSKSVLAKMENVLKERKQLDEAVKLSKEYASKYKSK